jgi:hypothetical protein
LQGERVEDRSCSVLVNSGGSLIAHGISRRRLRPRMSLYGYKWDEGAHFQQVPFRARALLAGGRAGCERPRSCKSCRTQDRRYYRMTDL